MPSSDTYLMLNGPGQGLYKEKGSKFIAYARPVVTEDDIVAVQQELRKTHYDARHHCYAWILGPQGQQYRANDDGEPNHSAGDPILGQIRSADLTNTLVIVVRYFGGTKLGVSGLINAYKTAAAMALEQAPVQEKLITQSYVLHFEYAQMAEVMRLVKDLDLIVVQQDFQASCHLHISVRLSLLEPLKRGLEPLYMVKLEALED